MIDNDWIVIADVMTDEGIQVEVDGTFSKEDADQLATSQFHREEVHRVVTTRLRRKPIEVRCRTAGELPVAEEDLNWPYVLDEVPPDLVVGTGVEDGSIASRLSIYYLHVNEQTWTYVRASGRKEFPDIPERWPWRFDGRIAPDVVRAEYLEYVKDDDEGA